MGLYQMQLFLITIAYFISSASPAYAHGEEVLIPFGAAFIAYIIGFIFLARSKVENKRKLCALGFLLAGIMVDLIPGKVPYLPNMVLINSATIIGTFCAVGFSIWICRPPSKNPQKRIADIKKLVMLSTLWVITIIGIFTCLFSSVAKDKLLNDGIAQLKARNYVEGLQRIKPLAENGDLKARSLVAEIYAVGRGVEANVDAAKHWLSCDAIWSCVDGEPEYELAYHFLNETAPLIMSGERVEVMPIGLEPELAYPPYDVNKAIYWMKISSSKGYKDADAWLAKNADKSYTKPQ